MERSGSLPETDSCLDVACSLGTAGCAGEGRVGVGDRQQDARPCQHREIQPEYASTAARY